MPKFILIKRGGNNENPSYISVHGLQTKKLYNHKGQKNSSGQDRDQKTLQVLQQAYRT